MKILISKKSLHRAKIIGSAMRLARSLSGSYENVLKHTNIINSKKKITLQINKGNNDLCGEAVNKKIRQLGDVLGKKEVKIEII